MHGRDGQKDKINLTIFVVSYTTYFTVIRVYTKFEDSGSNSRWEIYDGILWERKKNEQITGMISIRMLNLSYTIQLVIPNVCNKFQNRRCSSCWKIFDTDFPILYTSEKWKKEKGKKRVKRIIAFWFYFTQYTSILSKCIQNLKTLALLGAEKPVTKKIYWRKRKRKNKEYVMHEDADSLLHNTKSHTQSLYEISKS